MPIPAADERKCGSAPRGGGGGAALSLPVLAPDKRPIRPSRSGKRRGAVLLLVNLLIVGHLVLWASTGMRRTLSPVEPSEAMYTLEQGLVNAGFIFFVLAILSTLVLGRWFCGWGCHVVALQDLCGWMMKKLGVRPKPFRSRLLVMAPLVLALYMFVWPTFKREVVRPLAGERWAQLAPYLGEAAPRPTLKLELTKEHFWETFPAWYVAVPFLLICGFGCVYFLGSKGFCTYGCPYGGFFGPADRVAPGRILVTDACEHCGHCTTVCTSNVRVHEEVRDFGMVVDPGCMKCLDCVSVCPNDALYFGFARPPVLGARAGPAPRERFKSRVYDLPLRAEIVLFALGIALFFAFRNMFGQVPMLMAVGMAAIAVFLAWKTWEMLRVPSVRLQNLQLKLKGRMRPAGYAVGALTLLTLAAGGWGAVVKYDLWRGGMLIDQMTVPLSAALAPGFEAPPRERDLAERGAAHLRRGSRPAGGGIGWGDTVALHTQAAYAGLVLGNLEEAERHLDRSIDLAIASRGRPDLEQVQALVGVLNRRAVPIPEIAARFRRIVQRAPASGEARLMLANLVLAGGDAPAAAEEARRAIDADPDNPHTLYAAGLLLGQIDRPDWALPALARAAEIEPGRADLRAALGLTYTALGRGEEALAAFEEALNLDRNNTTYMQMTAQLLHSMGRAEEASAMMRRANDSGRPVSAPPNR